MQHLSPKCGWGCWHHFHPKWLYNWDTKLLIKVSLECKTLILTYISLFEMYYQNYLLFDQSIYRVLKSQWKENVEYIFLPKTFKLDPFVMFCDLKNICILMQNVYADQNKSKDFTRILLKEHHLMYGLDDLKWKENYL